jgi:5'-3' exonuclease
MYRFAGENALLENMYLMASLFRYYNIHAVFVFDGMPPPQKTELIESRRRKKDQAKQQYDIVADQLKQCQRTQYYNPEIAEIEETMTQLRKRFARLREGDVDNVKELLVSFGFTIIDAEGEADVLCARLAIKKRVYACLSDDTDMFVYGCPVVLRHISLLNHSVVSYTMADILAEIRISQHEFKMMCVVNGTDYDAATGTGTATGTAVNVNASDRIFQIYDLLAEFKRLSPKEQKKYQDGGGFYDWIDERKKGVVNSSGVISMMTTEAMFDTSSSSSSGNNNGTLDQQYKQLLNRDDIYKHRIMEVMKKDDFIFISDESSPYSI